MDEQAIKQWHCLVHHGRRGRGFHYSDTAIETALMLKGLFKLPLRALEGFINSLFQLMAVPLQSPDYSCISKRAKTVDIKYRLPSQGPVAHLVIDATGLKVYGEGEWKIRKHGKEKRRVWRKLHLAVDATTHAVIAAEVSLETVADNEVLPTLLNPLRRKIKQVSADGAYDTKACHALLKKKGAKATIPPRKNAAPWEEGHPRNEAVTALKAGELEAMEERLRLSPALDSRDRHVPVQATHRANAEPAELQRPGGRNPGWREGDEQADRAWYACSPASELSGINGLGNGHPATDLVNNADNTSKSEFIWLRGGVMCLSFVALTRIRG